jgi:hypothetical protein
VARVLAENLNVMENMPEAAPGRSRVNLLLLIWAAIATVAAVILCGMVVYLSLRLYHVPPHNQVVLAPEATAPPPPKWTAAQPGPSPFESLQDADVIGRYRFFQDGEEQGKIRLLPSHSIINKDGTTYPRYHWEIQPDGIMTVWQRGNILLNKLERSGVYVAMKKDGTETMRIEKMAE